MLLRGIQQEKLFPRIILSHVNHLRGDLRSFRYTVLDCLGEKNKFLKKIRENKFKILTQDFLQWIVSISNFFQSRAKISVP